MSSSTAAIAANSTVMKSNSIALDSSAKPNYRRRMTTYTEKKSNVETVPEGGISGANGGKITDVRALSNSIRGETVIERPKGLSEARKEVINSTMAPRRRKVVLKPEKPRWKTVVSILMKNLLLLLVLFWVGHKVWKFVDKFEDRIVSSVGVLDFEGRISEVEGLLKKTAKMMQAQVEVIDKKIESEVGNLRREMTKKVEEKGVLLGDELKKMEERADGLDKSLADLRDTGFFTKEEFEKFLNELKMNKDEGGSDGDLNLDKIRALAREIVEKEIEKHAADGLGMVDYALASGGAKVVRHSEIYIYEKATGWLPVGKSRNGVHSSAQKMLEPSFGEAGQCFALKGTNGFVEIRLRTAIIPEAVTLEHVAKSVAYDRSSAPRDCKVFAWFKSLDDDLSVHEAKMHQLIEFTYDLEKSNAQTFNVVSSDSSLINMVRFEFSSNQGNPQHTCIYRLRVHGYEPNSLATLAI